MIPEPHRFLLIDSYDSFTYNLASLCRRSIPNCRIHIIKNNQLSLSEIIPYIGYFSGIIVGPGPGSPQVAEDIGIVKDLWRIGDEHLIPIFGVCLGLQSLAVEHGAQLKRLAIVKHGQVSRIKHTGVDIFKAVTKVHAVRYHSLHVELAADGEIEQLAWAEDGDENGDVVMAIKHKTKPFWAVQYHPESVLTEGGGIEVMLNFWRLARNWMNSHGRRILPWDTRATNLFGLPWPNLRSPPLSPRQTTSTAVTTTVLNLPHLHLTAICELFGALDESSPFVLLDSASQPGRFSIIGCLTPSSPRVTYSVGDSIVHLSEAGSCSCIGLGSHDIWSWLASFMNKRKVYGGSPHIPFWGGLIGYLSYELGIESLHVPLKPASHEGRHPDVNFVFIERSVVLDTATNNIYVQSLIQDDDLWLEQAVALLQSTAQKHVLCTENVLPSSTKGRLQTSVVSLPHQQTYKSRINIAKEHLFAGDSYELCLTARTRVKLSSPVASKMSPHSTSWQRYKRLREVNPAPHAAYLRLHPTTMLSSSPERFLSFTRAPQPTYQLRPIKGTIRKGPGITRAIAEEALAGSTKEVAENLMIVDLIRHDLHGVIGEDVQVKQFCQVEEYKTVWQLVSVIEGKPAEEMQDSQEHRANGALGWEVLRQSLPPGSMTGAPKKRSVEILQALEDDERGIYSGVFGYWCVGGGGDWSVTIRSCFKYDDHHTCNIHTLGQDRDRADSESPDEEWVIGAGGAITALSDADAEWEEMIVKLQSVLRVFGAVAPRGN